MVSNETNIILRPDTKLQESTIIQSLISVIGSKSGIHTGDFLLTDDDQTIVFNPSKPFAYDEVVTVSVQRGIKTLTNFEMPEYSFSFKTETLYRYAKTIIFSLSYSLFIYVHQCPESQRWGRSVS